MRYAENWYRANVGRVEQAPAVLRRAAARVEYCGSLRELVGDECFAALVQRGQTESDFRRGLVGEMRPFVWIVRNARQCSAERVVDAVAKLHHFDELLWAIGVDDDARWRVANCLFD